MEDVQSFHTRAYDKSEEFEKQTLLQRVIILAPTVPQLIVKLLIVLCASVYHFIKQIFYCFVPKPLTNIRGQLAVVTGGSNGIGRETCLELARCGCNIACLDLDLDAAKQLCVEIRQLGVKANAYEADVSDPKRIEEVKREINADLGIVNILVNNAGLIPKNSLREGDAESIRRVMDVNVLAHFWTTRTFIGDMIERHSGYVVGIASMIAFYPASNMILYSTSKYAVKGFMDALTRESLHENWGVKTLTVFPNVTNTRKAFIDHFRRMASSATLERIGMMKPIEVAKEIIFALRTDAGYVAVPSFYLLVGKIFQLLPFDLQNFADQLIMPRITSQSNHIIAKEHKQ